MEGLFLHGADDGVPVSGFASDDISLLARAGGMEVMRLRVDAGATAWLSPAETPEALEFFFVHKGRLILAAEGGDVTLGPGAAFHICGLREAISLRAEEDARLLYVSSSPMFQDFIDFERDHERLLACIQEKDHYTHTHCLHVMDYALRLFERLRARGWPLSATMEDMAVAAMFHDIGKIYVPDEVLLKQGRLTDSEFRHIRRHSTDSAALLLPVYGARVADIARDHHERLDGSGYPEGRSGAALSPEARILAVADCFDAMTTNRPYQRAKPPRVAAEELCGTPDKLDPDVTALLYELVVSGALWEGLRARPDPLESEEES